MVLMLFVLFISFGNGVVCVGVVMLLLLLFLFVVVACFYCCCR